jgi:hypothetical protein
VIAAETTPPVNPPNSAGTSLVCRVIDSTSAGFNTAVCGWPTTSSVAWMFWLEESCRLLVASPSMVKVLS